MPRDVRKKGKSMTVSVIAALALVAGVAVAAPASQASAGTFCNLTHFCGNLYNYGRYSLRINTNLGAVKHWNAWLAPGHSSRGDGWVDTDGFYLPAGSCAFMSPAGSQPGMYFGSKYHATDNKITDNVSRNIKTYYC